MNFGQKLIFAALGSILTIVGMLFSPLQKSRFGEIECTKLRIVNEDGIKSTVIGTQPIGGGYLHVYDQDGNTAIGLGVIESGGYVAVFDKGSSLARLSVLEDGGAVVANGKDGESRVSLGIGKHGGHVNVIGGDGKSWVALSVDEHGGVVGVKNKEGKRKAFVP